MANCAKCGKKFWKIGKDDVLCLDCFGKEREEEKKKIKNEKINSKKISVLIQKHLPNDNIQCAGLAYWSNVLNNIINIATTGFYALSGGGNFPAGIVAVTQNEFITAELFEVSGAGLHDLLYATDLPVKIERYQIKFIEAQCGKIINNRVNLKISGILNKEYIFPTEWDISNRDNVRLIALAIQNLGANIIFCPGCGKANTTNLKFCSLCGKKLE
jgi:hypothetical protein